MIADTTAMIGWDVGGAHLKACLVVAHEVVDVAQWPCTLWKGLDQLEQALGAARARWPDAIGAANTHHALTMTGEMVDLFPDRATGVRELSARLAEALGPQLVLYTGVEPDPTLSHAQNAAAGPWVAPHDASRAWRALASANWRATAAWVARCRPEALVVDIGSTTTDLIAVRDGAPCAAVGDDAARLADGSLVYQGVVRTPLCALAPRVPFNGQTVNVINEFFATTADVYRLTQELEPEHDQQPSADGQSKDLPATRQRLARMIGRDAADADDAAWLTLAHAWRRIQSHEIAGQMQRVIEQHALSPDAPVVSAGCGDFLAESLARALRRQVMRFADLVPGAAAKAVSGARPLRQAQDRPSEAADGPLGGQRAQRAWGPDIARWAQVAAPAVAVALLAASRSAGNSGTACRG